MLYQKAVEYQMYSSAEGLFNSSKSLFLLQGSQYWQWLLLGCYLVVRLLQNGWYQNVIWFCKSTCTGMISTISKMINMSLCMSCTCNLSNLKCLSCFLEIPCAQEAGPCVGSCAKIMAQGESLGEYHMHTAYDRETPLFLFTLEHGH